MRITGPAPTRCGEICTPLSETTPVSCTGTGGRALFLKCEPPPQPATSTAPASSSETSRVRPLFILPTIPGRSLSEPNGLPLGDKTVHFPLDPLPHTFREPLNKLEILRVRRPVAVERDGLEKPDLELRGQVHHPCRGAEVGERVVHGEVDQPGESLQERDVRED